MVMNGNALPLGYLSRFITRFLIFWTVLFWNENWWFVGKANFAKQKRPQNIREYMYHAESKIFHCFDSFVFGMKIVEKQNKQKRPNTQLFSSSLAVQVLLNPKQKDFSFDIWKLLHTIHWNRIVILKVRKKSANIGSLPHLAQPQDMSELWYISIYICWI